MEAVKTNVIGTDNVLTAAIDGSVKKVVCLSTDKAAYPINAMASRGSVIPLFVEQLKAGKPLTVTDKTMTRFMMSLEDAVYLVLFAFENAEQGDIMVQKAPASTIDTFIKSIGKIYSLDPEVVSIGIRHGEKMYESLLTKEEAANAIDMGVFYRVPSDKRDLNYGKCFDEG